MKSDTSIRTLSHDALVLCILVLMTPALNAENWPQFRGPTGMGLSREKGIPLMWNATSQVAWTAPLPGESWSSPIVWGDRVFVTTATENGQSCRLISLDVRTGRVLWDKEVFRQTPHHKQVRNTYATPTPACDGERIYTCFGDGGFAALSHAGEVVWINRDYPFYGEHGLATSLRLHGETLLMARDGSNDGEDKSLGWQKPWDQAYLLALDALSGRERWKTGRGMSRISHGTPAVWEHDGKTLVVSEAGDVLQGFDFETGARLWSNEVLGEGKVPSTLVGDGLAFTAGGWGGNETIKAFRLEGLRERGEAELVWEQRKSMPKVPSMIYIKPYLFSITDGGVAMCLKAESGELVWQERVGGTFSASPFAAEGRIYLTSDGGETTVIRAGPRFEVLARNPLQEKVQASAAVSQGRIFIRTERNLFCIGTP